MSKNFKFTVKEVNEFKYVKNGILYTVEAVNFSKFAGDISFNAEIDGEIRSIIYILDTGAWLYDNEIDVDLESAFVQHILPNKSLLHVVKRSFSL